MSKSIQIESIKFVRRPLTSGTIILRLLFLLSSHNKVEQSTVYYVKVYELIDYIFTKINVLVRHKRHLFFNPIPLWLTYVFTFYILLLFNQSSLVYLL